jgi:hypothetical protein
MSACWLGQESFLARLIRRYYTEMVGNVGLAVRSSFTCHVAGAGRADHDRWPDRLFKFHPIPVSTLDRDRRLFTWSPVPVSLLVALLAHRLSPGHLSKSSVSR